MAVKFRRPSHLAAAVPLCIPLLLTGCGGSGTNDFGGVTNTGNSCTNGDSYTPIASPVTAVAAAARISFAIRDDGTLWASGTSTTGQLGAGAITSSQNPIKIGDGFAAISASYGHSLGLKKDGTLWAWGNNSFGQLGNNSTTESDVPIHIGGDTYTAVSAGLNFSLAIKSDGTLWAWGDDSFKQLGVDASGAANCTKATNGSIAFCPVPVQVGSDNDYISVSAGTGHALALKADHSLWAWGYNFYGELGNGTTTDSASPIQIDSGYGAIAAGYLYSLGIKLDGSLMRWGNNAQGKPGNPAATDHVPTKIGDGFSTAASALSASKFDVLGNQTVYYHSLALKSDGSLWAWGNNLFGQLGDGTVETSDAPKQILAGSGYAFTAVSAGDDDHSLAIKNDGSLWAWGRNSCGALGDGTTDTSYVPIQVSR